MWTFTNLQKVSTESSVKLSIKNLHPFADAKPDLIKQTQKVYLGTCYLDLHSVPAPVLVPFVTTQITQEEPIINSVDVGTRY